MNYTYSFEKMGVWQLSRAAAKKIYLKTRLFPKEELFGLTSQIRRACISVCCNLAEGSARKGEKEQSRFYEIAFGSAVEVVNLLILSNDMEYLPDEDYQNLRTEMEKITFNINRLYNRFPGEAHEAEISYNNFPIL